jgi:hypothetical protein
MAVPSAPGLGLKFTRDVEAGFARGA